MVEVGIVGAFEETEEVDGTMFQVVAELHFPLIDKMGEDGGGEAGEEETGNEERHFYGRADLAERGWNGVVFRLAFIVEDFFPFGGEALDGEIVAAEYGDAVRADESEFENLAVEVELVGEIPGDLVVGPVVVVEEKGVKVFGDNQTFEPAGKAGNVTPERDRGNAAQAVYKIGGAEDDFGDVMAGIDEVESETAHAAFPISLNDEDAATVGRGKWFRAAGCRGSGNVGGSGRFHERKRA